MLALCGQGMELVLTPPRHVVLDRERNGSPLRIRVGGPGVAHHLEHVGTGVVGDDLLRIHRDDRAVSHVDVLVSRTLGIPPDFGSRAEERLHQVSPGAWPPLHEAHEGGRSLCIVELDGPIAKLARRWRLDPDLALLVDDRRVVPFGCAVQGKHRPAVFHGVEAGKVIGHVLRAGLRFEGVAEELGVPVEQALGRVPAVLVHGGDHQEFVRTGHCIRPCAAREQVSTNSMPIAGGHCQEGQCAPAP